MKKIIIAILLCLGFNLSYADTSYYTFVMYKPTGTNSWQHFYSNDKIVPGLYRFQIITLSESQENKLTNWWDAIWGEFQFVADPLGGVKIYARNILNERNSFSSWTSITKNWTDIRQKKLQPIIAYMKKEEPLGYPDPNLMRLLILKKSTNESWQWKGKNYHIYRLHYFDSDSILQDEHKLAMSYFISPNEAPSNDVDQLKERLNNKNELTLLAQHAGNTSEYEELHGYFKAFFNKLLVIDTKEFVPEPTTKSSTNYWWWFIILIIIVLIYRNKKIVRKIKFFWNHNVKLALRRNTLLHPEQPMTTTTYMYKEDVELLKIELRQLRVRMQKLEEVNNKLTLESKEVIEETVKVFLNGQFNNDVNGTLELYANQFWQEFINNNVPVVDTTPPEDISADKAPETQPNDH